MINEGQTHESLIKDFTVHYMGKMFYYCLKKTGNSIELEKLLQDFVL